jgi:hypothetical protein
LGCPRLGALRTTLETIGTLHNLERDGPLAITEAAGVVVAVAATDEPAPPSA